MKLICGDRLRDICLNDGVIDAVVDNIGFDSVDVRLDSKLKLELELGGYGCIVDLTNGDKLEVVEFDMNSIGRNGYTMDCGEFVLGELVEHIALPEWVIASFSLRSVFARNGLGHALSHWIKPGWSGKLVLELSNNLRHNAFVLRPNMVLGQIHFYDIRD
jgi:deoxycytidine triphosphate deaminase